MKLAIRVLKRVLVLLGLLALTVTLLFGYSDMPLEYLKAKYAKTPSSFMSIDGMEIHYRDEGPSKDSIPIVLIHGTGSSLHTFNAWADELKQHYRIIRMDLPGYGLTGPFPNRDYSTEHYVDFLSKFLYSLDVKKCVLAGNSLGGSIAWNFTFKHPDMVDKLVLIDASGYPTLAQSEPIAFKMAKIPIVKNLFTYITPRFVAESSIKNVYADKSKVTEELVDRYFELTLREGNRQAFVDRLGTKDNLKSYKNITYIQQPTLVLWGEEDDLIPKENAYRFLDDLPNVTLVILKNVGHVPMEERPKESLEIMLSFLKL